MILRRAQLVVLQPIGRDDNNDELKNCAPMRDGLPSFLQKQIERTCRRTSASAPKQEERNQIRSTNDDPFGKGGECAEAPRSEAGSPSSADRRTATGSSPTECRSGLTALCAGAKASVPPGA